jgi:hypothetical protein
LYWVGSTGLQFNGNLGKFDAWKYSSKHSPIAYIDWPLI